MQPAQATVEPNQNGIIHSVREQASMCLVAGAVTPFCHDLNDRFQWKGLPKLDHLLPFGVVLRFREGIRSYVVLLGNGEHCLSQSVDALRELFTIVSMLDRVYQFNAPAF